jgi:hypothetical protein
MARKPGSRYASAAEMAEDLERFRVGDSVRARKPGLGTGLRSGIWKVRRRVGRWALPTVCILIGLVLLVYVVVLTVLYWTGRS